MFTPRDWFYTCFDCSLFFFSYVFVEAIASLSILWFWKGIFMITMGLYAMFEEVSFRIGTTKGARGVFIQGQRFAFEIKYSKCLLDVIAVSVLFLAAFPNSVWSCRNIHPFPRLCPLHSSDQDEHPR
jgi:hypothetical protein